MSEKPPSPTPPLPPPIQTLTYAAPAKEPSKNRWWMVLLRIVGGLFLGTASGFIGLWLASITKVEALLFIPPGLMLAALIVIAVKFRRFGYITGFLLAPFVAAAVFAVFLLIIIIIVHNRHHP
jgi:hypothetical protein